MQCRTMAWTTTIMSMARASAAMTAAWRLRRHELWRELQRITSKRATHTRRCSSTTTQTIWVVIVTSPEGEVVQHIEYVPFGEVFIEERNNIGNTPYLFNAKEFDEETGLYYYESWYRNN